MLDVRRELMSYAHEKVPSLSSYLHSVLSFTTRLREPASVLSESSSLLAAVELVNSSFQGRSRISDAFLLTLQTRS